MKNRTKAFVLTTVIGLSILYFTYSNLGIVNVVETFKHFSLKRFLIYITAVTLIEIFLVIRWNTVLKAFKLKVPFHNLFLYKMSGYAVGYLSPQAHIGGEPVRALLLKRHNIKFKQGISSVLIDKSMQLTTDLLFAFVGASALFLHFSISRRIEFLIFGFITAAISLLGFYFYCMIKKKPFFSAILSLRFLKKNNKLKKLREDIIEVENTLHVFYVKHFNYFIRIIIINLFLYVLMFVEYSTAAMLFGFKPSIFTTLIVMGGVALSYSLPVPMALGVLEVSQISALGLLRQNKAIGLSISLLVRMKDIIRTVIGSSALLYFGINKGLIWKQIKGNKGKKNAK